MTEEAVYIDSMTRYKQLRELKKAKKSVRKDLTKKVGKKAAARLVKHAADKVMAKRSGSAFGTFLEEPKNP